MGIKVEEAGEAEGSQVHTDTSGETKHLQLANGRERLACELTAESGYLAS